MNPDNNGECLCDDGTWDDNGTCKPCGYHCLTCSTENTCIECSDESRDGEENCICRDGTYDDGVNAVCPVCCDACDTCYGPTCENCIICYGDLVGAPICVEPIPEA